MARRRAASMRFVPAGTSISLPSIVSFDIALLVGGGLDGPLRNLPQESDCAGKAGARTAPSALTSRFELRPILLDVGDVGAHRAVVERADRRAGAALRDVEDRVEIVLPAFPFH